MKRASLKNCLGDALFYMRKEKKNDDSNKTSRSKKDPAFAFYRAVCFGGAFVNQAELLWL